MTDISKCLGDYCALRDSCWRHVAPSSGCSQSYIHPPRHAQGSGCHHWWAIDRDRPRMPLTDEDYDGA